MDPYRVIEGASAVTPTYFSTQGGVLRFTEAAFLSSATSDDGQMKLDIATARVGNFKQRASLAARYETSKTEIRDISLEYDDGSITKTIPIADLVIEYRREGQAGFPGGGGIGVSGASSSGGGGRGHISGTEPTHKTDICIGIPSATFSALERLLHRAFPNSAESFTIPTLQEEAHSGHRWLLVRSANPLVGSFEGTNGSKRIDDLHSLIRILKSNVVGDGFVQMRMKRSFHQGEYVGKNEYSPPAGGGGGGAVGHQQQQHAKPWEFAMTLIFVEARGVTDVCSANLIVGRRRPASEELIEAVKATKYEQRGWARRELGQEFWEVVGQ